jgi:hypothetical protein
MVGDGISSLLGLSLLSRFRLVLDYKSRPAFLAIQD